MPEMEELEPEIGSLLTEERLVGFEPDVAPAVEIEVRQAVGQRRNGAVEGRGGEVARPLHDVLVAEWSRRGRDGGRGVGLLRRSRGDETAAGSGHNANEQRPAG